MYFDLLEKNPSVKLFSFLKDLSFLQNNIKVGLSPSKKNVVMCFIESSLKNDEECFLFHLKTSFRSQDIHVFIITFWSCKKNSLIRKIRLVS